VIELKCEEVWREISNYVDGEIAPERRRQMEAHFKVCRNCAAVLDGTRNVVQLSGDGKLFDVPKGFGQRLYAKLNAHLQTGAPAHARPADMPLGITGDRVPLGSHLIYFWESDDEFASGVRFLELGFSNGEHCVLFGHDEANERVLGLLRAKGYNVEGAITSGMLIVLRRESSAPVTLGKIEAAFAAAVRDGAQVIRYLGNLGMGTAPLPGKGADEVLALEAGATALAHRYPCVIVCMYDVNTVPGRLVLNGGFGKHPLAVCQGALRENPYYALGREPEIGHRSIQ